MTRESIQKIFDGMSELLVKKNEDYKGASFDLGIEGNFTHIWDKVSRLRRLKDLYKEGKSPNFESIEDTYRDIIGYCVIGLHIIKDDYPYDMLEDKRKEVLDRFKDKVDEETLKMINQAFTEGFAEGFQTNN